jgi:hypothetical protein
MKKFLKRDYPLSNIRRYLEPGPIVLVTSAWQGETNIMTMGWHMMMQFTPALFGCYNQSAQEIQTGEPVSITRVKNDDFPKVAP